MRLLTAGGSSLAAHVRTHGALRLPAGDVLLDAVDASGLVGRGGAGFPTGRKMRTVSRGRRPVVLGNACEGEPASEKDATLIARHPHLVLDGLQVAARAVGAEEVHVAVHDRSAAHDALQGAVRERREPVVLHRVPERYVASEESALVNFVNTGVAKPTFTPPRPYEQGIGRRPTLVNNAETLAHLALIARHGPQWFRSVGDPAEPGTLLVTIVGRDVRRVVEVETGAAVSEVLARVGVQDVDALLVGGYFGAWVSASQVGRLTLTHRDLQAAGGALGTGVLAVLPSGSCGLTETARVAGYLADQNAGQCGPCVNGLPAIAWVLARLAVGPWDDRQMRNLDRWLTVVPGRGACHHPDGAVRLVLSALSVFADDVAEHRAGRPCSGIRVEPVLPLPRQLLS